MRGAHSGGGDNSRGDVGDDGAGDKEIFVVVAVAALVDLRLTFPLSGLLSLARLHSMANPWHLSSPDGVVTIREE